jgi:hypothetical protein
MGSGGICGAQGWGGRSKKCTCNNTKVNIKTGVGEQITSSFGDWETI